MEALLPPRLPPFLPEEETVTYYLLDYPILYDNSIRYATILAYTMTYYNVAYPFLPEEETSR